MLYEEFLYWQLPVISELSRVESVVIIWIDVIDLKTRKDSKICLSFQIFPSNFYWGFENLNNVYIFVELPFTTHRFF